MFIVFIAAAALAAAAAVCAAVCRERRWRRRLVRERAAHRLTEGCLHRDLEAFRARIEAVALERAVVEEAGRVVEAALVSHSHSQSRIDPSEEGGPA